MRNPSAALTVLFVLAAPVSAATAIGNMPKLVATDIMVTSNGARSMAVSSDETARFCARFRLSPREVKGYFASAQPVNAQAYHHDLDMSRCHAAGTVRFSNGWRGQWTIDRMRRGAVRLADGRRLFFYCVDCTSARFDPLDDADRETGRALIRASRITG